MSWFKKEPKIIFRVVKWSHEGKRFVGEMFFDETWSGAGINYFWDTPTYYSRNAKHSTKEKAMKELYNSALIYFEKQKENQKETAIYNNRNFKVLHEGKTFEEVEEEVKKCSQ